MHKKYLSTRVRLIPNHKCLKAYNGDEWTVELKNDITEFSLFPDCVPSSFITASGMKSFKIIKEVSGARKLISYFTTWDQKCRTARFDNAENSNKASKAASHSNTNSKHFLGNHRFHNQNKKDNNNRNSGSSTKKNFQLKTNQSNRSDVNKLIAGLKAILEQLVSLI
ncbi:hypothetical protein RCL_jg14637.t1 [Rhizophagus clarus]|uniref:Uncharacterized protein n=1 Tax=Rhizophagus clarus TaxID=94130 RepID=A0A8H3M2Y8_9GLOM|nr:hypothetical protein RCL_jg14637.t1 [Rhizophagus clarus]